MADDGPVCAYTEYKDDKPNKLQEAPRRKRQALGIVFKDATKQMGLDKHCAAAEWPQLRQVLSVDERMTRR